MIHLLTLAGDTLAFVQPCLEQWGFLCGAAASHVRAKCGFDPDPLLWGSEETEDGREFMTLDGIRFFELR